MTMPQVTSECADAVLCKALVDDPTTFALETLQKFHAEQPDLANMICYVANTLLGGKDVLDSEDPEVAAFGEVQLTTIYALIGLTYNALTAQVEANEMEEVWA
tara:strand:+ start:1310 stop:1618 length:309 start_codon:yes stop_codon:yes gene_type:complete